MLARTPLLGTHATHARGTLTHAHAHHARVRRYARESDGVRRALGALEADVVSYDLCVDVIVWLVTAFQLSAKHRTIRHVHWALSGLLRLDIVGFACSLLQPLCLF
jgi:hypothetical protein